MMLDSFCKVQSIGRVGPTPSITVRDDGSVMASFQVSTALPLRSASQTTASIVWQNVIAFGAVAEFVRDHIPEGTRVYFEGTVYPTVILDSRGMRVPQVQLAAYKVIPLITVEDRIQLTHRLASVPSPRARPVQAVPQQEAPSFDSPF